MGGAGQFCIAVSRAGLALVCLSFCVLAAAQSPRVNSPAANPFAAGNPSASVETLAPDPAISAALAGGRLDEAEKLARAAYDNAKASHGAEDRRTARALANLANVAFSAGRLAESERQYREALDVLRRNPPPGDLTVPETLQGLGTSLLAQGQLKQGEALLREALGLVESRAKRFEALVAPINAAKNQQELLAVLMRMTPEQQQELGLAVAFVMKAAIPLMSNYARLAGAVRAQGRLDEAEAMMRQFRTMCNSAPPSVQASCDIAMAQLLLETGKFGEAEQIIQSALANDAREPGTLAEPLANKLHAGLLLDLQRPNEARAALQKAIEAFRKTVGPDHPMTLDAQLMLGMAVLRQKQYPEAERLILDATNEIARVQGPDSMATVRARYLLGLARGHQGREKYEAAREDFAAAYSGSRRWFGEEHPSTVSAGMAYAMVLEMLGSLDEAARVVGTVREAARRVLPTVKLEANYVLATLLTRQGKHEEALPLYREGADLLETLYTRTRGLDDAARGSFAGQFDYLYRDYIGNLLALHERMPDKGHDREVLAAASRGQSRLFSEILRQADVARSEASPAFKPLKEAQDKLRKRIDLLTAQRSAATDSAESQAMARTVTGEIEAARAELAKVEEKLWRQFPRYMELAWPQPVTVEQLQKTMLRDDEALLTFALLPDRTVILAVSRKEFRLAVSPLGREALGQKIRAIRAAMEGVDSNGLGILHNLKPEDLHELYRELVAPAMPLLGRFEKWLLVADGPLHTLPFEMLLAGYDERAREAFAERRRQAEKGERPLLDEFAGLDYLGNRHRLSYLPSLSALVSQRLYAKPRPAAFRRQLVAFADPVFGGEAGEKEAPSVETRSALSLLSRSVRGGQPLEIPRLEDSADEAREVARAVGGAHRIFQRREAQEFLAKKEDLRSTRYLLFATHGFLGGEFSRVAADLGHGAQPPQPALAMTLVGDTRGEDGLLTMKEVVEHLDLNADLVALSACNSAGETAQANTGEGFAGLTRAFMYAGARGLLVNHWSVESGSARFLSVRAFSHGRAGMPPAAALAKARKEAQASSFKIDTGMQISRAHPFFWAPFVFVGD
jgi:CHAT domain-containing protein